MIRRLAWLILGAVLGVAAYRRLAALTRAVSPAALTRAVSPGSRSRQLAQFAADVREGMARYMERHPGQQALTLADHSARPGRYAAAAEPGRTDETKDGR